jgi:hypothetical protein
VANSFIDTQELSDSLGRDLSSQDGAQLAIDMACATCRTIAEQDFTEATETIALDGTGTDALLLPQLPVSSISSVTVSGTATTAYVLTDRGMLVKQSGVWPRGRQNVVVKYKHGYRSTDVPDDVRMVALELAKRLVIQGPAVSETNGDVSVRYGLNADDLTANERRILRKHRGR